MNKDRNIVISFKASNSFLNKLDDYVQKNNLKDNSTFIRESIQLGMDFIDNKEIFKKEPDQAQKFLEDLEPKITSMKREQAILEIYKDLTKKERESIFLKLDQERKNEILNEKEMSQKKFEALRLGYELEPKVGYEETQVGNFEFFTPILPSWGKLWNDLTQEQKATLLADQQRKLQENETKGLKSDQLIILRKHVEELSKELNHKSEPDVKLKNFFKS